MALLIRALDDRVAGAREALALLFPHSGRARLIGVTGPPGVGKSTLVDALITSYRAEGARVGIIAIDPTSPFTGGAVLGDRVRMQRHTLDDQVFIRSLATRGQLGGLSRSALDVSAVLDACGYDPILLETVGVGQDEVDVVEAADCTVVVTAPGLGDEVQALKAGIFEIADVLVVNKADRDGADRALRDLTASLQLRGDGRPVELVRTVAARQEGLVELRAAIGRTVAGPQPQVEQRLARRTRLWLMGLLRERLDGALGDALERRGGLDRLVDEVGHRRLDPYATVDGLIAELFVRSSD
jgi:LAO/AO transport system kinase